MFPPDSCEGHGQMEVESNHDWVSGPCPSGPIDYPQRPLYEKKTMVEVRMQNNMNCPRGPDHGAVTFELDKPVVCIHVDLD